MEKNILTCTSPEFGTIEAIVVDMRPWYFGKQAADAVGLSDPQYRTALRKMSAEDIRRKNELTDECDPYSRRAIYVSAKGSGRNRRQGTGCAARHAVPRLDPRADHD